MLTGDTYYSWADTGWVRDNVSTYYWSGREIDTTNIDSTGIVETHCIASLRVYPNPANNQLTIAIDNGQWTMDNVEIYNVVGQLVYTPLTPLEGGIAPSSNTAKSPFEGGRGMSEKAPSLLERAGGEVIIDISHLAKGLYFLKIDNKVVKFIKE
jgi:hypothetical protein